jgi:hypothetical protein
VGPRHRPFLNQQMVGMGYHLDERHDLTVGEQQIDRILTHDPVMVPSAGTGSDA